MNYSRTKAIKSVKNVLSFGRKNSCDERQSLFSRESSLESDVETLNDCDINTINTETENFSAEESRLDRFEIPGDVFTKLLFKERQPGEH